MKKFILTTLAVLMIFSMAACSEAETTTTTTTAAPTTTTTAAPTTTTTEATTTTTEAAKQELTDIMATIMTDIETSMLMETPLDSENFEYFAFIPAMDGVEGLASEAAMSSVAHSVVLFRVSEDVDVEAMMKSIEDNMDPRKWICVEAEKTYVLQNNDLVILIMSNEETADKIAENFNNL